MDTMTTNSLPGNPPSKTVQGLPEGALRTTMTHVVAGDMVLVQTITADPEGSWVAAPAKPTKRAIWGEVIASAWQGITVDIGNGAVVFLDYVAHTAITIKDREAGVEPVGSPSVEVSPTVTIQGSHVHAEAVPCGRVYDDERVNGIDTTAAVTCPGCLSQPTELIAGDGSVIRVGSRVTVIGAPTHDMEGYPVAPETGTVEELAEYREGVWCGLVTVRLDRDRKPWGLHVSSLATLAESEPVAEWPTVGNAPRARQATVSAPTLNADEWLADAYASLPVTDKMWSCMTCGDRFATVAEIDAHLTADKECPTTLAVTVAAPKSEAQRRAIRKISWVAEAGATPTINGATVRTLTRDGWIKVGAATRTITLTDQARAWVASEHTAEVAPYVLDSGVTVYGATCNCGPGQENPRMRRVPWSSGGCVTAEDAVAVALGHGAVSRPHYVPPVVACSGCPTTDLDSHSADCTTVNDEPVVVAPAWGTWKTHGKPTVIRYYGNTLGHPTAGYEVIEVSSTDGTLALRNRTTGTVTRRGAAWRFYALPHDEPVIIVEASTAPGFKIDFGPEITDSRRGVDRITAGDAEMLSGEPMPLVIMHPVIIEEPLTVADVVDLMTPAEAVNNLHARERRWERRRKASTSGNRRTASRRS